MPDKEYRITQLEGDMEDVKKDMKLILEKHLPRIDTKVAVLIAEMLVVMAGMAYLVFS